MRQAMEQAHVHGVSLGDEPHPENYMLKLPLARGPPVFLLIDPDHAMTDASPRDLAIDREAHIAFIKEMVRSRALKEQMHV